MRGIEDHDFAVALALERRGIFAELLRAATMFRSRASFAGR